MLEYCQVSPRFSLCVSCLSESREQLLPCPDVQQCSPFFALFLFRLFGGGLESSGASDTRTGWHWISLKTTNTDACPRMRMLRLQAVLRSPRSENALLERESQHIHTYTHAHTYAHIHAPASRSAFTKVSCVCGDACVLCVCCVMWSVRVWEGAHECICICIFFFSVTRAHQYGL